MRDSNLPAEFKSWLEFYEHVMEHDKPTHDHYIILYGTDWFILADIKLHAFEELYKELRG